MGNEVNFKGLAETIEAATNALKTFADAIAHSVSLMANGYDHVRANRDRKRLKSLYKELGNYALSQAGRYSEYYFIVVALERSGESELNEFSESEWSDFKSELSNLLPALNRLMSEIGKENSDFILEKDYRILRRAMDRRRRLFRQILQYDRPTTDEEIEQLRAISILWGNLLTQLDQSLDTLGQYIAKT